MNTNRRSSRQEVGSGRNAMTEDEHPEMENPFRLSNGRQRLCVVVGGVFILKGIGGAVIYGSIWMLCAQTPTAACLNPWLYMPWCLTSIFALVFMIGSTAASWSPKLLIQSHTWDIVDAHTRETVERLCPPCSSGTIALPNPASHRKFAHRRRRLVTWS